MAGKKKATNGAGKAAPRQKSSNDPEIQLLNWIWRRLRMLNQESRTRVADYITRRANAPELTQASMFGPEIGPVTDADADADTPIPTV